MRYAIEKTDGGIAVVTLLPIGAVSGGAAYGDIRILNGAIRGVAADGSTLAIQINGADVGALDENSLADCVLLFSPIAAEFTKWPQSQRDGLRLVDGQPVLHKLTDASVPSDRAYRSAWVASAGAITHDMTRARESHKNKIRAARKPELEKLDIEMTQAYKDSARQDAVEAQRQALRDLPDDAAIASATSIADLKAAWPTALLGPMSNELPA